MKCKQTDIHVHVCSKMNNEVRGTIWSVVMRATLGRCCLGARSTTKATGKVWTPHRFGYSEERWGLGGWCCHPWAGLKWRVLPSSKLLTPSPVPPGTAQRTVRPVAGGGKGQSIRPSPPPSYTACAMAYMYM